jgi:hypothetical protein
VADLVSFDLVGETTLFFAKQQVYLRFITRDGQKTNWFLTLHSNLLDSNFQALCFQERPKLCQREIFALSFRTIRFLKDNCDFCEQLREKYTFDFRV